MTVTRNARKRSQRHANASKLRSGMEGNGGPATPGNGHASLPTDRASRGPRRETPYRVIGSTAGSYTTRVAGNTARIYREER